MLTKRDKKYLRQRLINIAQAREEICERIKSDKGLDCKSCPLNYEDYCGSINLPPIDMDTMLPESID